MFIAGHRQKQIAVGSGLGTSRRRQPVIDGEELQWSFLEFNRLSCGTLLGETNRVLCEIS